MLQQYYLTWLVSKEIDYIKLWDRTYLSPCTYLQKPAKASRFKIFGIQKKSLII